MVSLLKATTHRNANTPPLHVLDSSSEDRYNPGSHAHSNHRGVLPKIPVSTVAKSKRELCLRHHSDDRPPIRPPHGWDAPNADLVPIFDERVDRRRKPALVPGGFHVRSRDAEAFSDWDDDLAFRDIGVFGEKRARNVVAKNADFAVPLLSAHELSSLKRKT